MLNEYLNWLKTPPSNSEAYYEFRVLWIKNEENPNQLSFPHKHLTVEQIERYSENKDVKAIYITLNPGIKSGYAMGDKDITSCTNLVLDIDAERLGEIPQGFGDATLKHFPATDTEHDAAIAKTLKVAEYLKTIFPYMEPAIMDSGNGGAIIIPCANWKNDEERNLAVKAFFKLIKALTGIQPDQTTFNASRIYRVPETWNRKSICTPERPFRKSKIIQLPATRKYLMWEQFKSVLPKEELEIKPKATLEEIEVEGAINETYETFTKWLFPKLDYKGIQYKERNKGDEQWIDLSHCPVTGRKYDGPKDCGILYENKILAYHSFHDGERELKWNDCRKALQPDWINPEEFKEMVKANKEERIDAKLEEIADMDNTTFQPLETPEKTKETKEKVERNQFKKEVFASYQLTDLGAAEHFSNREKENILWCGQEQSWYVWDGLIWRKDKNADIVRSKIHQFVHYLLREWAPSETIVKIKKIKIEWALKQQCSSRISALERESRFYFMFSGEFDIVPDYMAVKNGILHIPTGQLVEPDRKQYISRQCQTNWNPEATHEKWSKFLDETFKGNENEGQWFGLCMGYSILGRTTEHIMPIFYGPGGNGKSTAMDAISYCLGDELCSCAVRGLFLAKTMSKHESELLCLVGRRIVLSNENNDKAKFDEEFIKSIASTHANIQARGMREDFSKHTCMCTLMMSTNSPPSFSDKSKGMKRRLKLVPFTNCPTSIDYKIAQKLEAEAEGILLWLVNNAQEYLLNGLHDTEAMIDDQEEYAEENDAWTWWWQQLKKSDEVFIPKHEAYLRFQAGCSENGVETEYVMTPNSFYRHMKSKGFKSVKKTIGDQKEVRCYGMTTVIKTEIEKEKELFERIK